jgi:hypothetical protein
MNHRLLRIVGILFWIVAGFAALAALPQPSETNPDYSLSRYLSGPSHPFIAQDPTKRLRANDPIFCQRDDGEWTQIGYVTRRLADSKDQVEIAWYTDSIAPDACRLEFFENDGSLESVVATILPPAKRRQIQRRLAKSFEEYGDELTTAFIPLIEQTLERSLPVIESGIRQSAARHRSEIDQLSERWNKEIVDQRLIPLARREILPILREHGEPTATMIGRELWDSASVWRFGWRMVYDNSPLPKRNLAQQEWDRFVEEEAIPIFEKHMDAIVASVQKIVREVASNEAVQGELATIASEVADDPESRKLAHVILKESILENEPLKEIWREVWTTNEARAAWDLAGERLEPVVRKIADDLFGTQSEGINPDFARVLRNQVLGKDRRWLVAQGESENPELVIHQAETTMPYPAVYLADKQ